MQSKEKGTTAGFILALIGGIITLFIGILIIFLRGSLGLIEEVMAQLPQDLRFSIQDVQTMLLAIGLWGALCGCIGILSGFMMRGKRITGGAILAIIFGVLGVFTGQGFFIGPILIVIGGIIGAIKR